MSPPGLREKPRPEGKEAGSRETRENRSALFLTYRLRLNTYYATPTACHLFKF